MSVEFENCAETLMQGVANSAHAAQSEFALQHLIEGCLGSACGVLGVPWIGYSVNVAIASGSNRQPKFADSVHGGVVIEYKAPGAFGGRDNRVLKGAREQLQGYAELLAVQEGRPIEEFELIAWDGNHISFGRFVGDQPAWDNLVAFDSEQAGRLLLLLQNQGRPLVHPILLSQLVGPESECGARLIPHLYSFLVTATGAQSATTKTKLLFTEWNRLFGQVVGFQSDRLRSLVSNQMRAHQTRYPQSTEMMSLAAC